MLRGCDEVIESINKLFGSQEVAKPLPRKLASDLLAELGALRIEEGSKRVENCELFKPQIVEDFEK